MKNAVLAKLCSNANDIDVPEVLVESELDSTMSEFDQQLRSQGLDLESLTWNTSAQNTAGVQRRAQRRS